MPNRFFKIRVVSGPLLAACGRFPSASTVPIRSIAVRIAIPALLARKFSASATGSISRSNIAFEHVCLSLDGNHPTSVISGDSDTDDDDAKFPESSIILNNSKSVSMNASDVDVSYW